MTDPETRDRVDGVLRTWRQGDCFLGEDAWFLFRSDPSSPLTTEAAQAAAEGFDAVEAEVCGFMVASQTCDLVRTCDQRPFVEVCPLIEVRDSVMSEVRRARRPNYAFVPGVERDNLVADLDRVMTVEKAVVATWPRIQGCPSDAAMRHLAAALSRKRARFAFPDDFVSLVSPFANNAKKKHGRNSPAGAALRALREIRVQATPSWDADQVALFFLFIPDEDAAQLDPTAWAQALTSWLNFLTKSGRFTSVDGLVAGLDELTSRDYVESDPLDLDHLSFEVAK